MPSNKFIIIQDKTLGLCDSAGEIIIHPKYELIDDLDNGYVIVKREGKYGVVTTTGVSTIPLMYDYLTFDVFNSNFLAMIKAAWQEINLN